MAYPSTRSILDFGKLQLGAAKATKMSEFYTKTGRKFGQFTTGGGGYLTKFQSKHLVAHLKAAIETEGADTPGYTFIPYSEKYEQWKKEFGGSGMYQLTGTLLDSIKILNRRYGSSGSRGTVVGIDQRLKVADQRSRNGRIVAVATYAYSIEFGISTNSPRMLLTYATQDFLHRYGPKTTRGFFRKFLEKTKKEMGIVARTGKYSSSKAQTLYDSEKNYMAAMREAGVSQTTAEYYWKNNS